MTRYDEKKETCWCQVCRSDMAYLLPCVMEVADDTGSVSGPVAEINAPVVAIFPIPFVM